MKGTTLIKNMLNPKYSLVIFDKILKRGEKNTRAEATNWAMKCAEPIDTYCLSIDRDLWKEAKHECSVMEVDSKLILQKLNVQLGGGGAYTLISFLVQKYRPETVVETGVAAGWSSRAILEAIEKNGKGRLYSSDFPYFRLENPEKFIGVVIPEILQKKWHLDIRGDRVAIPDFAKLFTTIDFFHYDSDKSYSGRKFVYEKLKSKFAKECIVMMDDIQDNLFFKDLVEQENMDFKVFEFEGKFIGAIGL